MRTMEIPCFPRKVEISDLDHLYKTRLKQKPGLQAAISIPLLAYMGCPNDPAGREDAMKMLRAWLDGEDPREFLKQIPLMHRNWGRHSSVKCSEMFWYGWTAGVKRTSQIEAAMSAYDPTATFATQA